jgi:hypothetical protein
LEAGSVPFGPNFRKLHLVNPQVGSPRDQGARQKEFAFSCS